MDSNSSDVANMAFDREQSDHRRYKERHPISTAPPLPAINSRGTTVYPEQSPSMSIAQAAKNVADEVKAVGNSIPEVDVSATSKAILEACRVVGREFEASPEERREIAAIVGCDVEQYKRRERYLLAGMAVCVLACILVVARQQAAARGKAAATK
jgi:hypothetical protein